MKHISIMTDEYPYTFWAQEYMLKDKECRLVHHELLPKSYSHLDVFNTFGGVLWNDRDLDPVE